jgi:hypothetical protein
MKNNQQTSNSCMRHEQVMSVEWIERQGSLAEMQKTLCNTNDEQLICLLAVVGRELSQQQGDTRVVGTGANQTKSQDGTLRNIGIGIV